MQVIDFFKRLVYCMRITVYTVWTTTKQGHRVKWGNLEQGL